VSIDLPETSTRDRIRDAALALFGSRGYDGSSVRDIAERATVSPALVIHHFGSKSGLRDACDEWIVDEVLSPKEALLSDNDMASTIQRWLADVDANRTRLDYLARMITDGTPAGDRLFDDLVNRTEAGIAAGVDSGMLRSSSDPHMTAVILAGYGLMPFLLERHLSRALGTCGITPDVVRRMTLPTLELYTHGLYSNTSVLDAATTALARDEGIQE